MEEALRDALADAGAFLKTALQEGLTACGFSGELGVHAAPGRVRIASAAKDVSEAEIGTRQKPASGPVAGIVHISAAAVVGVLRDRLAERFNE